MSELTEQTIEGTTTGGQGLAVVLSGGGARAAYQVGCLRTLVRHRPDLHIPILTGVSAGAINAACLAADPDGLADTVERLSDLWTNLEVEQVFRVDPWSLARSMMQWAFRLVSGGGLLAPEVRGLVDTTPLRRLLQDALGADSNGMIPGIARNIESGRLRSFTVITSNLDTGQTVVWVEGQDPQCWERPNRRSRTTRATVDHILASSALPLFFPAVKLESMWHGDGGIRLTNPLSPAIHLGADRVLAISTRFARSREEADRSQLRGYPPPLQIASQLLNAIFLDALDQDALRIGRLNLLLRELPAEKRHGLREVDVEVLRPSQDLGKLASEFESRLPKHFRYLTRSLGSRETSSPDFLSLVMFQGDYCRRMMELGEADAEDQIDRLLRLVDG